ncbi:MAG: HD domain-containing protein [Chloroflexi bacterium]|nr:HD domain-containing protein [Chloroflexota bacterium]
MTKKINDEQKTSPSVIKHPIAQAVSGRLAILITIITALVSFSSYAHSIASTESQVREQLLKYTGERGLRESELFLEANAYLIRFQEEYIERYIRMGDEDPIEWFEEHMEKHPDDGTYRSRPELYYGVDRELGRRDFSFSVIVGAETNITPETRRELAIGYDMVKQYGPVWRKPFINLYFGSPEKTFVDYWPGTPAGLLIDAEVEWREEEWFAITTIPQNPQREQRWSGVLYDERDGNWMVSSVTPLDIDGRQVGMVGTDLLLDDLVERTVNETLVGTYNILLQTDGRIIAHPDKIEEIIANAGFLFAQDTDDEHISRVYEQALTATSFPVIIDNKKDNEFLAVALIEGPDWYFITVYPKLLMQDDALQTAGFTLLSGFASLIAMAFVIWLVLKRNLAYPLEHLTQTVRDFEKGNGRLFDRIAPFVKKADELSTRPDETGLLANSFVKLGERLKTTYSELEGSKNDLERSNENLLLAYDATIEGWAQALELRDMETEGHSRRVVEITMALAKRQGFKGQELVNIQRGALLHDIGKMGIPDVILQKPGKLSSEEWEIMKLHPVYAFEWLSSIEYLRPALDIPYCHHEKWDGSGYPRGIKENAIPFAARIFAVADVYDALLSDRPYRKAWSEEKALDYIRAESGKYFDPEVVDAFFKLISRE